MLRLASRTSSVAQYCSRHQRRWHADSWRHVCRHATLSSRGNSGTVLSPGGKVPPAARSARPSTTNSASLRPTRRVCLRSRPPRAAMARVAGRARAHCRAEAAGTALFSVACQSLIATRRLRRAVFQRHAGQRVAGIWPVRDGAGSNGDGTERCASRAVAVSSAGGEQRFASAFHRPRELGLRAPSNVNSAHAHAAPPAGWRHSFGWPRRRPSASQAADFGFVGASGALATAAASAAADAACAPSRVLSTLPSISPSDGLPTGPNCTVAGCNSSPTPDSQACHTSAPNATRINTTPNQRARELGSAAASFASD